MAIDGSAARLYGGTTAGWAQRWSESLDVSLGAQQSSGGASAPSGVASLSSLSVTVSVSSASAESSGDVYSAPRGFGHAHSWKALSVNAFDAEARLRMLMLERMTGHQLPLESEVGLQNAAHAGSASQSPVQGTDAVPAGSTDAVGSQSVVFAAQQTELTATGELQTVDGKKIDFAMSLDVSAAFAAESETGQTSGAGSQAASGDGSRGSAATTEVAAEFASMSFSLELQTPGDTGTMTPDSYGTVAFAPISGNPASSPNGDNAVVAPNGGDAASSGAPLDGSLSDLLDSMARYIQQALSSHGSGALSPSPVPQPLNLSA